jgi:hypothetical protein
MSLIFSKEAMAVNGQSGVAPDKLKLAVNAVAQWNAVMARRAYFNTRERQFAADMGLHANAAALIPTEVYREIDNVTKAIMRDIGEFTFLSDMAALSKSLPVGKIEHQHRRASDSGSAITSISGQVPNTLDKAQYSFEKSIIPIHSDAYGREWRELEGQRSEGFDGLIDDAANSTHAVRAKINTYLFDGDANVVFNGQAWTGLRNDSRVASIDLGAGGLNVDFSSSATTAAAIRNGWISMRNTLRITNNAGPGQTYYVSPEILSNLERFYADDGRGDTILQTLLKLTGVDAIKEDPELSGNQVLIATMTSRFMRLLTGMAVNTVPLVRNNPNDNFNFMVWAATGMEVLTDFDGKTGVAYASA